MGEERTTERRLIWQKVKSSWLRGSGYFSIREESESLTRAAAAAYAPFIPQLRDRQRERGRRALSPDNASESSLHSRASFVPLSPAVREYPEIRAHRHDLLPERHSTGFRAKTRDFTWKSRTGRTDGRTGRGGGGDRSNQGKTAEDRASGLARAIGSIPSSR